MKKSTSLPLLCLALSIGVSLPSLAEELKPLRYNHPGLTVDLGVGLWAWPLPMDWDKDGDLDLVVACPDKPYRGIYFFENREGGKMPVFEPAVKVGQGRQNMQLSFVDGEARVLTPAAEWIDFRKNGFTESRKIYPQNKVLASTGRIRANQWRYVDFDGDGAQDLIVGSGDWADYGWDDAFDQDGRWTRGPLHGRVHVLLNQGDNDKPDYQSPVMLQAGDQPLDVFGMPSPNFADFDDDGDLDLICGEFLDGFTYFENVGSRTEPKYASGRRLSRDGEPVTMDLQMITPAAVDWDGDGDTDLICGDEDGRVALVEHLGKTADGLPQFRQPQYFQQKADLVKFGALVTPVGFDWDGDGDEDLICGNTAGYIGFIENLDGGAPPRFAAPRRLKADGEVIRIEAGENGSIQGPAEAKWGYTTLTVADWDGDQLPDLIVNSIWGKVVWHRNIGSRKAPKLTAAQPVKVAWNGKPPQPEWNWWRPASDELATQWRTTPVAMDLNGDGLCDLAMLDHEGYLSFFERTRAGGELVLQRGKRIFTDADGKPLQLNSGRAGRSGRRKICLSDWNGDGKLDLLVNSQNASLMVNVSQKPGRWAFEDQGLMSSTILAGHTTSPTVVDWTNDGRPELLVGAEDGHVYYMQR